MEKEAYQLLLEGKYQEAYQLLEELVSSNPTESALFNIALALYHLKELEEAKRYLQELTRINPQHKKGLFLLGVVCRRLGEMECAKEAFVKGGFEELAQYIPEPVAKREEEPLEVIVAEETKEETSPEPSTTEIYPPDIIRCTIEGTFSLPREHFAGFITEGGALEEGSEEINVRGKGELLISCIHLEGNILSDQGEGQLMMDIKTEKMIIKVNPKETVYYVEAPLINWLKM